MRSKYVFTRKIELDELGAPEKGAYLVFNELSWNTVQQVAKVKVDRMAEIIKTLEDNFIEGMVFDQDGKLVKVEKGDVLELPSSILLASYYRIAGFVSPN